MNWLILNKNKQTKLKVQITLSIICTKLDLRILVLNHA